MLSEEGLPAAEASTSNDPQSSSMDISPAPNRQKKSMPPIMARMKVDASTIPNLNALLVNDHLFEFTSSGLRIRAGDQSDYVKVQKCLQNNNIEFYTYDCDNQDN